MPRCHLFLCMGWHLLTRMIPSTASSFPTHLWIATITSRPSSMSRALNPHDWRCAVIVQGLCGSPIDLNNQLKPHAGPYLVVLPNCKACADSGCHVIVRAARSSECKCHACQVGARERKGDIINKTGRGSCFGTCIIGSNINNNFGFTNCCTINGYNQHPNAKDHAREVRC